MPTLENIDDLTTIYINIIFRKRLEKIAIEDNEHKSIIVFQAILILHQLAHLLLRWDGKLETPSHFLNREAGCYFEERLFDGYIFIGIAAPEKTGWNENIKIAGITIDNYPLKLLSNN